MSPDPTRLVAPKPTQQPVSPGAGTATIPRSGPLNSGPLTEADAIDIWIARWLNTRRKDILARYGCDPRRLYEIWEEVRFRGAREKARALFEDRYPGLVDRIDYGPHRRIPRTSHPDQMHLFD